MILPFIISFSLRTKNTHVSRFFTLEYFTKNYWSSFTQVCDFSSVNYFYAYNSLAPIFRFILILPCGHHTNSKQWLRSIEISRISVLIFHKWGHVLALGWSRVEDKLRNCRRELGKEYHGFVHSLSEFWVFLSYFSLSLIFWGTTK